MTRAAFQASLQAYVCPTGGQDTTYLLTCSVGGPQGCAVDTCEGMPPSAAAGLLSFKALAPVSLPPNSLLHQGSGVSVNSDYKLSAADIEALKHAEDTNTPLDLPSLAAAALLQ